ncbi:hypothetical protein NBRC116590_27930 [Pelagimonas sp. KU-00592-HH]|uniref:DUF7002 family protein n=1 Tax=Pelagimonas sp. KU-00592-HH TaxID=3127651 RepID=UPI003102C00A
MTADEFAKLVGDYVVHKTASSNLDCINKHGLMCAETLAQKAGIPSNYLVLRKERLQGTLDGFPVILNDQKPLRAGQNKLEFLEGHSMESWSKQLDQRVFFWPQRRGAAFNKRLSDETGGLHEFLLDSRKLHRQFKDNLYLSPINSGNATRSPSKRGDWLYVCVATKSPEQFKRNRQMERADRVAEISLTADIPPVLLQELGWKT